ncbi:MAG: hypothetical protein KKB37_14140, partial [Alphaproteobacteria bacterium]|nr:hypothetical protein [Alphaproteobacteria bacterium]
GALIAAYELRAILFHRLANAREARADCNRIARLLHGRSSARSPVCTPQHDVVSGIEAEGVQKSLFVMAHPLLQALLRSTP